MTIPIIIESANLIGNRKAKLATIAGTDWKVSGTVLKQMRDELITLLERQAHFLYKRRYIVAGDATFALYYANGWQYDIVRADNAHCPSGCILACKTYMEALEAVTKHAAQYAENCKPEKAGAQ